VREREWGRKGVKEREEEVVGRQEGGKREPWEGTNGKERSQSDTAFARERTGPG